MRGGWLQELRLKFAPVCVAPLEMGDAMRKIVGTVLMVLMFSIGSGVASAGPLEDGIAAYRRGDYATAVRLLHPLAEQGNAVAQYNLGAMYAAGKGVAHDYRDGAKWFGRAAEQGNADAQYSLGFIYDKGLGVVQDYREAIRLYRLAAEQGHAEAQFTLGNMYREGQGVAQDYREAGKWYRLAAEQGDSPAQYNLGLMYAQGGGGTTQDYREAAKWFRLAAEHGGPTRSGVSVSCTVRDKVCPRTMSLHTCGSTWRRRRATKSRQRLAKSPHCE
jgi:hypothetical protein